MTGSYGFQTWHSQIIELASMFEGYDLRAYVLGPTRFRGLYPSETVPIVFTQPTPLREGERMQSTKANAYNIATKNYDTQQKAMRALRAEIIKHLDEATTMRLGRTLDGLASVQIHEIIADMTKEYGKSNRNDTDKASQALLVPYNEENSFRDYVASHTRIYRYLATCTGSIADDQKVRTMIAGVQDSGKFTEALKYFNITNFDIDDNNYETLVRMLINADKINNSDATVGGGLLANAARINNGTASVPTIEHTQTLTPKQQKEVNKLYASFNTTARDPKDYTHYCFIHGPSMSHNSDKCFLRDQPGFQKNATMQNKMGGRTEPWEPKGQKKGDK